MRPPEMLSDIPVIKTRHYWYPRKDEKDVVALPKVPCSAWKSSEGEVAVVFVNWASEAIEFTYKEDTVEYGFSEGTAISCSDLTDNGREPNGQLTSGICQETITLPARSVKILVLKGIMVQ